jgi:hypothetical protein
MNSKNPRAERCVFCNSASHKMERCNSNMNGRREYLNKGSDFLMHDECPNFNSLAANELRFIAWHYGAYEGAIRNWWVKPSRHYNRKYGFNPIPLSLSKKKMICELVRRWEGFSDIRNLSRKIPELPNDDYDCPICLESMTSYEWNDSTACWKLQTDKKFTTACNHCFCRGCFVTHISRNSNRDGTVGCPYCRTQLVVT